MAKFALCIIILTLLTTTAIAPLPRGKTLFVSKDKLLKREARVLICEPNDCKVETEADDCPPICKCHPVDLKCVNKECYDADPCEDDGDCPQPDCKCQGEVDVCVDKDQED